MTKQFGVAGAALVASSALLTACGAPTPLPDNDPLITQAISAFEKGCIDTAPGFAGVGEI